MLSCHINIDSAPDELFQCGTCQKRKPNSALNYPFKKDLNSSQQLVSELKYLIESNSALRCRDTLADKDPDLLVIDITINNFLLCRVEAKYLEGKSFVTAPKHIGLNAKETLVVDEPKLLHYFERKKKDEEQFKREVPLFVVWKFDRPCEDIGGIAVFQEIDILQDIYKKEGGRHFERKTATNDFIDGKQKGIIKKYHFSIKETQPIWKLISAIFEVAAKNNLWQFPSPPTFITSPKGKYVNTNIKDVKLEDLKVLSELECPYKESAEKELEIRRGDLS